MLADGPLRATSSHLLPLQLHSRTLPVH